MNLNCGVFNSVLFTHLKKLVYEVFPIFLAQSVHEIRVESGLDYGTACIEPHLFFNTRMETSTTVGCGSR